MRRYNRILFILLAGLSPVMAQEPKPASDATAPQMEIELSTMECTLPGEINPAIPPPLTYAEIEALPEKSAKLLDRVTASGKSDTMLKLKHIVNPTAKSGNWDSKENPLFAPGETGTLAVTELLVGADQTSCVVNIVYRFREQADSKDEKNPHEISFITSFTTGIGKPAIIHLSAVPGREGTFIVVIARVRLAADAKPAK